MKISYHKSEVLTNNIGACLNYKEIVSLLESKEFSSFEKLPHNMKEVIIGRQEYPQLDKEDVLISTSGPYSWYYFYKREKDNGKYRIIYDMHNALFTDYFLQNLLSSKYLRAGDWVMFNSEFQRQMYLKLFSHTLDDTNTIVCYPGFARNLPDSREIVRKDKDDSLTIGYFGSVSDEKGFDVVLNSFIKIKKEISKAKLVIGGSCSEKYTLPHIIDYLKKHHIDPSCLTYANHGKFLKRESILNHMKNIDILLFPSTCGESLGRVMLEAANFNIPVIAADFGAAPEIIDKKNLVNAEFKPNSFRLTELNKLADISSVEVAEKCIKHAELSKKNSLSYYKGHDALFRDIIEGNKIKGNKVNLTLKNKEFIDNLKISMNPRFIRSKEDKLEKILAFLRDYLTTNPLDIINTSQALARFTNYSPVYKITKSKKILFISPHMDDIALSCGGTLISHINQLNDVRILSVFSEFGSEDKNDFVRSILSNMDYNKSAGDSFGTVRRREEMALSRLINTNIILGGFNDAAWRCCDSEEKLFNLAPDENLISAISSKLISINREFSPDTIFVPKGLGSHIDHIAARDAALKVFEKKKILFYEDFPYCYNLPDIQVSKPIHDQKLSMVRTDITPFIKWKIRLINCYKSQTRFLFKSEKNMISIVKSSSLDNGRCYEKFWRYSI